MTQNLVLWFEDVGRGSVNLVGGKCASLGEMCRIGVSVPPGFAVTTAAYDAFMERTGNLREIEQYLKGNAAGPKTIADFEEVGSTIRWIIESAEMPVDLKEAIGRGYQELCGRCGLQNVPVAVRSSGVAEDMPTASFAGQYDSYLNVRGPEDVLDNVKKCWASMFTARCISYRVHIGLGVLAGSISVAVQKMVNARSAGVAFTVNPNTGDRSKVVIEGNWGVGESVVQGIATPDIFTVHKETLELLDVRISQKKKQYTLTWKGTAEENVPLDRQSMPCLATEEGLKIAEGAKRIESHYGLPIDIEWAIDNDLPFPQNVFLVQARPVTAMAAEKSATDKALDMVMSRLFRPITT